MVDSNKNKTLWSVKNLIDDITPMNQDNFYKWLNERTERPTSFHSSLDAYLTPMGYDVEKHFLDSDEFTRLNYIYDAFQDMWTPYKPLALNKLLRPVDEGEEGFWIMSSMNKERYKPTGLLRAALKDMSLIHDLNPRNFYFEIINGYLFIKYQTIIGSRRIAKLIPDTEVKA